MERLLTRLERRFGGYAIPNLILYIVAGMAIVWVLSMSRPEVQERLALDMGAVRHGQVWRLVTFLFIPPPSSQFWILINLYFTWWIGSSLEQNWGAFKFNAYYLLGAFGTIVASLIAGPTTNFWLDSSLFLAFATVFPDISILLFFILPIKVKWLGIVAAIAILIAAVTGDWATRASIIAALGNYFVFFSGHWRKASAQRVVVVSQKERRAKFDDKEDLPVFGKRVCAVCGAQELDGVDIRVCSCEKCGGRPRELCLTHARSH